MLRPSRHDAGQTGPERCLAYRISKMFSESFDFEPQRIRWADINAHAATGTISTHVHLSMGRPTFYRHIQNMWYEADLAALAFMMAVLDEKLDPQR